RAIYHELRKRRTGHSTSTSCQRTRSRETDFFVRKCRINHLNVLIRLPIAISTDALGRRDLSSRPRCAEHTPNQRRGSDKELVLCNKLEDAIMVRKIVIALAAAAAVIAGSALDASAKMGGMSMGHSGMSMGHSGMSMGRASMGSPGMARMGPGIGRPL